MLFSTEAEAIPSSIKLFQKWAVDFKKSMFKEILGRFFSNGDPWLESDFNQQDKQKSLDL